MILRKRFDLKFKATNKHKVNDKVVIYREPILTGTSRKLMRKFRSPYTVIGVVHADR